MINNWDKVEVYRYSSSGYYIDHKNVTTNGGTVTWDSLTAGTIYRFNAKSFFTVDSTLLESVNYSNTLEVTVSARPPNFQWDIPKVSGQPFQVTAIEWNKFTTRINDFRRYKGLSNYSFLTVEKGDTFYASTFNTAITAISAMNPPISPPSAVTPKSDILASYLNKIVESLNSIP